MQRAHPPVAPRQGELCSSGKVDSRAPATDLTGAVERLELTHASDKLRRRSLLLGGAAAVLLVLACALVLGPIAAPHPAFPDPKSAAALDRRGNAENGRLIFDAADCSSCHASPGQSDRLRLGGGQALASPFGTLRVPNISTDPRDGIGRWHTADLASAGLPPISACPEIVAAVADEDLVAVHGRRRYQCFPIVNVGDYDIPHDPSRVRFEGDHPAIQGAEVKPATTEDRSMFDAVATGEPCRERIGLGSELPAHRSARSRQVESEEDMRKRCQPIQRRTHDEGRPCLGAAPARSKGERRPQSADIMCVEQGQQAVTAGGDLLDRRVRAGIRSHWLRPCCRVG